MVLVLLVKEVEVYRVKYKDCSSPSKLKRINIHTVCKNDRENGNKTARYGVLQQMRNTVLQGHKCQVKRSKWTLYCGAFSHEKHISIPEIELSQEISITACQNMISSNTFISEYGTTHGIAMNEETVFAVNEKGMIHSETSGKVWCKGQQMKINDVVMEEVLVMSQYRITLETEEFLTRSTQQQSMKRVEALNDHVKLPSQCTAEHAGCVTSQWTYVWNPAPITCPFMKVQEGTFVEEDGYLVDHQHKVLFRKTSEISGLAGCPPGKIFYTDQRGMALTQSEGFSWIDRQLDMAVWSDQKDDYIVFMQEQAAGRLRNNIDAQLCFNKYAQMPDEIIPMEGDTFAKRRGDILYTFTCPTKIGKVTTMKGVCTNKIPLETSIYMDPTTRIASRHTSKVDCANHFPLTILSEDGWITVSDSVQPAIAPKDVEMSEGKLHHESMKTGGIYQQEAMAQFEDILEYGSFHQAVMETFGYGICRKEGGPCTKARESVSFEAPIYDISKLEEMVESKFSIFESLDAWITKKGGYLALTVIIGWTIQICIAGGMVIMTAIQDGIAASIAALYAVMCFLPNQVKKVRRQAARKRNAASAPQEEIVHLKPV